MTDTFEVPEHEHIPSFRDIFALEGTVVIPCEVPNCQFEATAPVASFTWIERIL